MTPLPPPSKRGTPAIRIRLRRLRRFLTRNEIFFKTVAATTLTFASLVVGVFQLNNAERQSKAAEQQRILSDKQATLADLQTRLAEAQALPSFDIRISQIANPATGKADNNVLTIENSGGPVREFSARAIYFVEVSAAERKIPYPKPVELRIPVNDYYSASALTATSKGNLATIFGNDNNASFITFSRALAASADRQNWTFANTEERTFLRLLYLDLLNRSHEEYYEVAPVRGSKMISTDAGRAAFAEAAPEKRISLRDLTVERVSAQLIDLMKTQKN